MKRFAVAMAMMAGLATQAAAQTQMELNEMAGGQLSKADAGLNAVYSRLMGKVSPAGKDALRQAQRSWLQFRDQECAFETMGTLGGSIHSMMVAECMTRLTAVRTTDLTHQDRCPEGDVSCGGQ